MMFRWQILRPLAASLLLLLAPAFLGAGPDSVEKEKKILPLDQVKPGMLGEWRTVVRGTEIESFPLEVLAVRPHHVAPNRPLIIAQALDDKNILSGPVSGMSGSPVYFEGKLAGAYAYGYMWAKEQAIIGITPIESMLEIWERHGGDHARFSGDRSLHRLLPGEMRNDPYFHLREEARSEFARAGKAWMERTSPTEGALSMVPLQVAGLSTGSAEFFGPLFSALGFTLFDGPGGGGGGGGEKDGDLPLEAGSPVAMVYLDGDFAMAGVGTVTHRDGDRLLAYGHPAQGIGSVAVPMAPAEIVTVVRRLTTSFKLSKTGPVVGSVQQDRQTGIAGEVGTFAPTTRLQIVTDGELGDEEDRTYAGRLVQDETMAPLVSAVALLDVLTSELRFEAEQTYRLRSQWTLSGESDPLEYEEVAVGPDGPRQLALGHLLRQARLQASPFWDGEVEAIRLQVERTPGEHIFRLVEVRLEQERVVPGESLGVRLMIENGRGERRLLRQEISVPADLRGTDSVELLVVDAAAAHEADPRTGRRIRSWSQQLAEERRHRRNDRFYLLLRGEDQGMLVNGVEVSGVPPSVRDRLARAREGTLHEPLSVKILQEKELPLPGMVRGSFRKTLPIQ